MSHLRIAADSMVFTVPARTLAIQPTIPVEVNVVCVVEPVRQVNHVPSVALVVVLLAGMPEVVLGPTIDVALLAQLHHPPGS